MKILSVFLQPSRDNNVYVVVQGAVNDIACYYGDANTNPYQVAFSGMKLREESFKKTFGAWNYEADGLHYRK